MQEETRLDAHIYKKLVPFIEHACDVALSQYRNFSRKPINEKTAKAFKEHQDACKASISHIQLIIKLALQAMTLGGDVIDENEEKTLQTLIENAQAELRGR